MTTKILNRRQARWSEFLSRFNFKINSRPGKAGGKPDPLTRRSGDLPEEGDERLKIQQQVIIKPGNISLAATTTTPSIEQLFSEGYENDPTINEIIKVLNSGTRRYPKVSLSDCSIKNVTNGHRGFGRPRGATIARRQRRSCEAIKVRRGNNTFVTMDCGQW